MATAARVVEGSDSDDSSSEDFEYDHKGNAPGSMELIHDTLAGIAARTEDEGAEGLGKHATIIRLGKGLWQSPALSSWGTARAKEEFFDDGRFPAPREALQAAAQAVTR